MKKISNLVVVVLLLLCGFLETSNAQKVEILAAPIPLSEFQKDFMPQLVRSISTLAVNTAFDYTKRPIIGVIVSNFLDNSGHEIFIGNEIAKWLRAGLSKEKQIYVYADNHPVSKSLKSVIAVDSCFTPSSQRLFQENLSKHFESFIVDLIITGTVVKETENQLKITATVIPIYKKIRLVETETEKGKIFKEEFLSPSLSSSDMVRALTSKPKGRLVVLSNLNPEFEQTEPLDRADKQISGYSASKGKSGTIKNSWRLKTINGLACWLDDRDKKLSLMQIKDWPAWKEKAYQDIFSGFEADTLWFDEALEEGTHTLFVSLSTMKDQYRTFSRTFYIKSGTINYLVFSIQYDSMGKPEMHLKYIVDVKNRTLPF